MQKVFRRPVRVETACLAPQFEVHLLHHFLSVGAISQDGGGDPEDVAGGEVVEVLERILITLGDASDEITEGRGDVIVHREPKQRRSTT